MNETRRSLVSGYRTLVRIIRAAFVFPIRLYQRFISPQLPKCCNYYPTCSAYAVEAIEEWGIILGSALALWRLLRCNPFSYGGYDPVPKRKQLWGIIKGERLDLDNMGEKEASARR